MGIYASVNNLTKEIEEGTENLYPQKAWYGPGFQRMLDEYRRKVDAQAPEPQRVSAPAMPDAGPSVAVPASQAPAAQKRGGLLGALASVFAPEAGSFWHSALQNGLWDARGGQDRYRAAQAAAAQTARKADADVRTAEQKLRAAEQGEVYNMGGTGGIVQVSPDGQVRQLYTPPPQASENERLIELWRKETDPTVKELIARTIRGYQYTPEVIGRQTESRNSTAEARAAATARHRAPAKGGGASKAKLPTGFILE